MEVFEVVPNFFDFVDDIVEVDIKVFGEEFFVFMFELSDDRALRDDHAAEIDDVFFEHEDVFEAVAGMVGIEDFRFHVVDTFTERIENGKTGAKEVISEHIEEIAGTFGEIFFAQFFVAFEVGEEFFDRGVVVVKGDEKVGPDEDVDLGVFDLAVSSGANRNMQDHENIIVVVVDFGTLAFGKAIFEVEGMEFVIAAKGVQGFFVRFTDV